jgi:hypothetical protein
MKKGGMRRRNEMKEGVSNRNLKMSHPGLHICAFSRTSQTKETLGTL